MNFSRAVLSDPIFWMYLTGIFAGAALSQLTIIPGRTRDPEKTRRRKPTKIFLLLSAAVSSVTVSGLAYLPGIHNPRDLVFSFAGTLVLCAAGFRFKRAAGIPLFFLFIFAVFAGRQGLDSYRSFSAKESLASVRVLRIAEDYLSLSLSLPGEEETVMDLPSAGFGLRGETLEVSDFYVFIVPKHSIRFLALTGGGNDAALPGAESRPNLFEPFALALPGVRRQGFQAEVLKPKLFSTYQLISDPEKGLVFREN